MAWAWVSGGSRGIGRAIVHKLAQAGYDVLLTYANQQAAADAVVDEVAAMGQVGRAICVQFGGDDAARAVADRALADAMGLTGCPDVLVHNAGTTKDGLFATQSRANWEHVLSCNLDSFYTFTRPVVRQMLKRRSGRIVTVASLAGERGNSGQVAYSASKAGLIGATKALALELAPRHITVNAVAPGLIETAMTEKLNLEAARAHIPMGRLGTSEEVAGVVAFLCSSDASYITGQVIGINGGLHT